MQSQTLLDGTNLMKDTDKITLTKRQLYRIVKESRRRLAEAKSDVGYVYLSDIFFKEPENGPQRALKKIFKNFDGESEELDNEVRMWMKEMINLPKNDWLTPVIAKQFAGVVWDRTGGNRGYGSAPALKFRNFESAEKCACLIANYGVKDANWNNARNWIGREYP